MSAPLTPRELPPIDLETLDPETRQVLAAAVQLGAPLWPDLLEAATGAPAAAHVERLVRAGVLRPVPTSRLTNQTEYLLAETPDFVPLDGQPPIHLRGAMKWMQQQAAIRPEPWTARLAVLEAAAGASLAAAQHSRETADLMRALGALPSVGIDGVPLANGDLFNEIRDRKSVV